jgi:hypothetical protein
MLRRTIPALSLALLFGSLAQAQTAVPYAAFALQRANAQFATDWKKVLAEVFVFNQAFACRAIQDPMNVFLSKLRALVDHYVAQTGRAPGQAGTLAGQIQNVSKSAFEAAKKLGACDYWPAHPDEVLDMRRIVNLYN